MRPIASILLSLLIVSTLSSCASTPYTGRRQVLLTSEGELLIRSRAVLRCLRRLGGFWRVLAWSLAIVPRTVADRGYDLVAAIRHRLFSTPSEACPLIPAELRARFDA